MAHPENGAKHIVSGHIVKVLKHRRDDRGMTLEEFGSRCVRTGEIHELLTTDHLDAPPGSTIDRVAFLGFVEVEGAGVIDRGDEVWAGDRLIGTVLGFDACHFPNHYNLIIATENPVTGPELGLMPDSAIRFVPPMDEDHAGRGQPSTILETVDGPGDLRRLDAEQLGRLAGEIRDLLVEKVSRTGGHLGPNLGVVELTIALHRVFDSPRDRIVWDTGHQAYVHKILTGRRDGFDQLRSAGGMSGYPSRAESEHDLVENSHASTALSYADGLAKANKLKGSRDAVVAVIGDGGMTGGMCWEALNNIAAAKDRPVIVVLNDNGRSYAPTIGGFANHLHKLRTSRTYERFLSWGKSVTLRTPVIGGPVFDGLHAAKQGLKDILVPHTVFDGLGLKYIGPVDGHDIAAVEYALHRARHYGESVVVHCITRKGNGYAPAESHDLDRFHAVGRIDPRTGGSVGGPGAPSWTSVFGAELTAVGGERRDVVAITAAMLEPTGLGPFSRAHPDRVFDVGIAEQHAVTSAAGLAMGGLHPVVAVYATFLNRAFDQTLMDVALHRLPVTFVLDRAGVTGDDGASHNGMWDLSILHAVPGLGVAVPRDGQRLRELFREAVAVDDGPTALRFPKGPVEADIPAVGTVGGMDVLRREGEEDVLIVAVGAMARNALDAAELLGGQGIGTTVVDPRWVKPVDPALAPLAARHRLVVTVEDNGRAGGAGSAVAQALSDAAVDVPVRTLGIPQDFLDHGKRAAILDAIGLSPAGIAAQAAAALAGTEGQRPRAAAPARIELLPGEGVAV
jgi:1-deoxy-D-xylulose-5-phosphate synthase